MLNAEKNKKVILDLTEEGYYFAVRKDGQNIARSCDGLNCEDCVFDEEEDCGCSFSRMKWMLSEYKEPIKLSRLEYEILKYVQKKGFNFITRSNSDYLYGDLYGNLFIYKIKPIKHDGIVGWCTTGESYVLYAFNDLFQFVKWEDEKPTSIKEVLENCAVENIKEEQ